MQKELQIFSTAIVGKDYYKSKYDEANKRRKQAWKDLRANFVPGSAMFKETKSEIEPEFQAAIQKAREEVQENFEREYTDLREASIAKVKVLTAASKEKLDALNRLAEIPMSVDEFNFLVEEYGNRNYWVDRRLVCLGAKNGIQECAVSPDITTKLGTLDELKSNLYEYLDKYNGEVNYSTEVLLSDAAVQKLERRYTNNYSGVNLNAKEAGKRIVTEALNKLDSMEKSVYLANALRTSDPDVRDGILYEICKNHEGITQVPTMMLTGVSAAVENYRKEEFEGMRRAEKVIEAIRNEPKEYERHTIIYQNLEDKYFLEMVSKSGDSKLKEDVKYTRELKAAGEAKEQREADAKAGTMANVGAGGE